MVCHAHALRNSVSGYLFVYGSFLLMLGATGCDETSDETEVRASLHTESTGQSSRREASQSEGGPPSLVFGDTKIDLGAVRDHFEYGFRYTNRGPKPVEIIQVHASCNCTTVTTSKRKLGPGEEGEILVEVDLAGERPGGKKYDIVVKYSDPKERYTKLEIRTHNNPNLVVAPPKLQFIDNGHDPMSGHFRVLGYSEEQLNIRDIETSKEWLTCRVVDESKDYANGWMSELVVHVERGNLLRGRCDEVVTLHTNDKEYPVVQVPVTIMTHSRIYVGADHVFPARSPDGNGWTATFAVCDREMGEIEVDSVRYASTGKPCRFEDHTSGEASQRRIDVSLQESEFREQQHGIDLEIHISKPWQETLNVCVLAPLG